MFEMVILAGGMATRLLPVTKNLPKALVDVSGEPFISRQLKYIKNQGISEVVLCLGHLHNKVISYVESQNRFGLNVRYVEDGDTPLGTGGAIRKALPLLKENFFVTYGDSYLPINFLEVQSAFSSNEKAGLLTVFKNDGAYDTSNVFFEDGVLIDYDKENPNKCMKHIDYGLSILSKHAFEGFSNHKILDLGEVYRKLAASGDLAGFEVFDRFYEVGSFAGLDQARKYFARQPF